MTNLQKGLVGHWTMDDADTSGGTLFDRSAYDRAASLSGNETTGQSGRVGESYQFPGTSPQQATIDLSNITWTGSHTLSVWVYYDSDSSGTSSSLGNAVFGDHNFHGPCLFADLESNSQRFWNENADDNINLATNISKGQWLHVVGRKDGANIDLFVDAVNQSTGTLSTSAPSNSTIFYIGGSDDQSSMKGRVDDARLYNRALSSEEIDALYNMRTQRYLYL